MLKVWCLTCALLLLPATASPMYVSGDILLRACQSKVAVSREFCNSYLLGVVDTHESLYLSEERNLAPSFCIGKGVSGDVLRKQVISFAKQYPSSLKTPGATFVFTALGHKFPCGVRPR